VHVTDLAAEPAQADRLAIQRAPDEVGVAFKDGEKQLHAEGTVDRVFRLVDIECVHDQSGPSLAWLSEAPRARSGANSQSNSDLPSNRFRVLERGQSLASG
jgi:hypothetical protein